ncbi:MAG TPA: hypothetical protein VMH85_12560 [Terriglobales bacterium]|nr:hypothetical protein [Terriglobales bacterium]
MTIVTKGMFLSAALAGLMLPAVAQTGATIHQRKENQQARIAQGVRSGQLTPRETTHLEKKEAALNRETRAMRKENGGKLTPHEKAVVNRQQNQLSRQIYRDKHNARQQ